MNARDSITAPQLGALPAGTPVTVVASRSHYAIAVGTTEAPRWLHSSHGLLRTFRTADAAAACLSSLGIRRFVIDLNGGLPQ